MNYNKNQALQRQWIKESKEFHNLTAELGDNMPYKTLAEFQELKYNNTKRFVSLQEKVEEKPFLDAEARKVQGFKRALENGEIDTKVRQQKQDEHISGTKARKRRIEQDKASGKEPSSEFKNGIDLKS